MRIFPILLLTGLAFWTACKNDAPANQPVATQQQPQQPAADSVIVSLRAQEFYKVTLDNPNIAILDLRSSAAFKTGHLNRATCFPVEDSLFHKKISILGRNQPYAVYCFSGINSMEVAKRMQEMGFKRVYHLAGGLATWGEAQQPLQLK